MSGIIIQDGALAERLRGGLQNLLDEFDSRTCLHIMVSNIEAIFVGEVRGVRGKSETQRKNVLYL